MLRAFPQRLEAEGRNYKVAMTACMRQLLVTLNAIAGSGGPGHQPIPKPRAHSDASASLTRRGGDGIRPLPVPPSSVGKGGQPGKRSA